MLLGEESYTLVQNKYIAKTTEAHEKQEGAKKEKKSRKEKRVVFAS